MHDTLLGFIRNTCTYCLNSDTVCFNGTPTPQKIAWPRDSKICEKVGGVKSKGTRLMIEKEIDLY